MYEFGHPATHSLWEVEEGRIWNSNLKSSLVSNFEQVTSPLLFIISLCIKLVRVILITLFPFVAFLTFSHAVLAHGFQIFISKNQLMLSLI